MKNSNCTGQGVRETMYMQKPQKSASRPRLTGEILTKAPKSSVERCWATNALVRLQVIHSSETLCIKASQSMEKPCYERQEHTLK